MDENLLLKLTKEQIFILKCARTFRADDDHSAILLFDFTNFNWDYLLNFAQKQGISPLLYKYLSNCSTKLLIPEHIFEKFRNFYFHTFSKNTRLFEAVGKLMAQFELESIDSILLKGSVLAELIYRDIGLRPMDDVDILVREKQLNAVKTIMEDNNYNTIEIVKSQYVNQFAPKHHLPQFIKDNNIFEIHWHIHNPNNDFDISIDDLWKRALPYDINYVNVQILRFEDMLLHLCIHLNQHFTYSNARFTNFCDIAEILRIERLNWEFIIANCKKYRIDIIVFRYLHLVGKYFDIKLPDEIQNTTVNIADIEKRFLSLLQNKNYNRNDVNKNISGLSKVTGFRNKIVYLCGDLFPTKEFMMLRFKLKNKKMIYFYYPLRFCIGIAHFFKYIFSKKINTKD